MEIKLGTPRELESWMALVTAVKDAFPGLETREALEAHRETVQAFMDRGGAVCALAEGRVVGVLLFSAEENVLCFLAVDPAFRRQHIAADMLSFALPLMDLKRDVTVTTYREGDPAGAPARAFYQSIGFSEGKLTEEFGSPVQEFVLHWDENEDGARNEPGLVDILTSKDDKSACAFADQIIAESRESDAWYAHFDAFAALLDHPKSLVRNRALTILAANAPWDKEDRFALILPAFLAHITDEKPITARQCVKALAQVGQAQPQYIPMILSALRKADLSKYRGSMRPLIEKDIAETARILTASL
ncbi:MAG: GNAT family N-acetyltransferase [Candidatus Limivicinus sp.]|nr:GNAT family N-acetyltransferase [Clostridiales bacterium]MDY6132132.1 GNAT family N-acetyltransferase [Candidatus Limivicinus sp.]